jgi:hypothetical protein
MNPRANSVLRLAVCLCFLVAGSLASAQSSKVFFSTPTNLSHNADNTAVSYSTHIAVDAQGNINVIWAEFDCLQVRPFTCTWHLYFTRSTDGATTFSTPRDIANLADGESLFGPQIVIDATGNISVAWEGDGVGANVFYTRSIDGGLTFSLPLNLSLDNGLASDPDLALDSRGHINIVWQSQNPVDQTYNAFFSRSTDGVTFTPATSLCASGESCNFPEIAIGAHNAINLVWAAATCADCNDDAIFSRSTDGGATFSAPLNLSNSTDPMVSAPAITIDAKGAVNVVWSKGNTGSTQVFYTRSTNGKAFSSPMALSTGAGNSYFPQLAVGPARGADTSQRALTARMIRNRRLGVAEDFAPSWQHSDAINAAWFNDAAGEVFFSRSVNHGMSFSMPKAVSTPTAGFGTEPYMAVDSEGRINLVWEDGNSGNILFTRSNDGGATFSKPRNVSSNPSLSNGPQVSVDAIGNLSVAWFDESTPIEDVFFSRGTSLNLLRADVRALPFADFKAHKRDAVIDALEKAKRDLTPTNHALAIADLTDLLQHVSGCGSSPGSNDWITNCAAQVRVRSSINIVINGLSQ